MATIFIPSCNNTSSIGGGGVDYVVLGSTDSTINATEANLQTTWRDGGSFANMYCRVSTNSATSASTINYRVGAGNGNGLVSITGSTTGEFTDSTHTDTVTPGDQINYKITDGGGGTGLLLVRIVGIQFSPTSTTDTINKLICNGAFTDTSLNTTYYNQLIGIINNNTVESSAQFKSKTSGTLNNLYVFVSANTASVATVTSRVATAAGNLSVSIGSGSTGAFEDTTHSDSISSGSLINSALKSTVTTSLTITNIAFSFLTANYTTHYLNATAGGNFIGLSVTNNYPITGRFSSPGAEALVQLKTGIAFTASNLEVFVISNSITANSNFRFRIGGANGNQVVTYGSSVSGYLEDTTHSDSVTTTSQINYQLITGGTGSSILPSNVGFLATYPSPPVALSWFPIFDEQIPFYRQQIPSGQSFEGIQPLNYSFPWFPAYPDQQRLNLKVQRDFVFDHPQPLNSPVPWLPQYIDLPRPNLKVQKDFVFDHPYAISASLPWFPRYPDQWPFFNQQSPSGMIEPVAPLRFITPQQPIYIDFPRLNLKVQRDFVFGPPPLIMATINSIPWFPQFSDLYREPARVKGDSFFAPPWALNFRMPWLPVFNDQQRLNLKVQRDFVFDHPLPLNLRLPWLPSYPHQVPFFVQEIPSGAVMPIVSVNLRMPWLPQYIDQIRLNLKVQRDFVFMPILAMQIPLPWLPQYTDQQRLNFKVQRDFVFDRPRGIIVPTPWFPQYPNQVPFFIQKIPAGEVAPIEPVDFKLRWIPDFPNQWPFFNQQLPSGEAFLPPLRIIFPVPPWFPQYPNNLPGNPIQPSLLSGYSGFMPLPPTQFSRLIHLRRKNRILQPDPKNAILKPKRASRVI